MSGEHDRERWERHPNIGGMAGMLLGIHDGFRRAARYLCREVDGAAPLDDLRRLFGQLASTLHHHHRIEEAVLFPAVGRISGEFPAELVSDHRELTAAIDRAARSLEGADREEVRAALAALETSLEDHLIREESRVIPILLETDPSELYRILV